MGDHCLEERASQFIWQEECAKNKTPFLPEKRTRNYPLVGNKIALWEALYNYLNRKLSSTKDRRLQAIISILYHQS